MPQPNERVVLDISFANFEYAINACLERCVTEEDAARLTSEILRVMRIRQDREAKARRKSNAMAKARLWRWL